MQKTNQENLIRVKFTKTQENIVKPGSYIILNKHELSRMALDLMGKRHSVLFSNVFFDVDKSEVKQIETEKVYGLDLNTIGKVKDINVGPNNKIIAVVEIPYIKVDGLNLTVNLNYDDLTKVDINVCEDLDFYGGRENFSHFAFETKDGWEYGFSYLVPAKDEIIDAVYNFGVSDLSIIDVAQYLEELKEDPYANGENLDLEKMEADIENEEFPEDEFTEDELSIINKLENILGSQISDYPDANNGIEINKNTEKAEINLKNQGSGIEKLINVLTNGSQNGEFTHNESRTLTDSEVLRKWQSERISEYKEQKNSVKLITGEFNEDNHYMIDMETLSTEDDAIIAEIALARFRPSTGEIIEELVVRFSIEEQFEMNKHISFSTLFDFWLEQDPEVFNRVIKSRENRDSYVMGWAKVLDFLNRTDNPKVWGKGPTFDVTKAKINLDNIIKTLSSSGYDFENPIKFFNERCVRTMIALCPEAKNIEFTGKRHVAIDDVHHQIKQVTKAINK